MLLKSESSQIQSKESTLALLSPHRCPCAHQSTQAQVYSPKSAQGETFKPVLMQPSHILILKKFFMRSTRDQSREWPQQQPCHC